MLWLLHLSIAKVRYLVKEYERYLYHTYSPRICSIQYIMQCTFAKPLSTPTISELLQRRNGQSTAIFEECHRYEEIERNTELHY